MSKFSEHVKGTAFSLTLSRAQIELLFNVFNQNDAYDAKNNSIRPSLILLEKGLIEKNQHHVMGQSKYLANLYRLTEAGRALMPLLELAELPVVEVTNNITKARKALNLSLTDLANKSNCSLDDIISFESGLKTTPSTTAKRLSTVLGIPPSAITYPDEPYIVPIPNSA